MPSDARWQSLRQRLEALESDTVLVPPDDERPFVVERTTEDAIDLQFRDGGQRTLWRDQFAVLDDRLQEEPISLSDLPPGVGPYVTVLSLAPGVVADESTNELRKSSDGGGESPFVQSSWDVRRPPEQVHDDALLAADFLERHDVTDHEDLSDQAMVDLYVLLSDVQWGADDLRRDVGGDLLDRIGPDGQLHGTYGTVTRTRRERRTVADEDVVLEALDEADVPREWVLGIDEDKLDVVIAATDVEAEDVYDVHEQYYVQKTGVEDDAKRSRLQGLKDRLAELDDEEAEELHEEIDALEDRIDDVLAAG